MKLIVENYKGCFYAFMEGEESYHRNENLSDEEGGRKGRRKYSVSDLDEECDLSEYEEGYWVFNLAEEESNEDVGELRKEKEQLEAEVAKLKGTLGHVKQSMKAWVKLLKVSL